VVELAGGRVVRDDPSGPARTAESGQA
jgi:hypothetical protein